MNDSFGTVLHFKQRLTSHLVSQKKSLLLSTVQWPNSRNRIVVSTPRCGRGNPGSNPGYGSIFILIKVGSDETRHLFGTRVGNFNFMGNHLIALICVYYGFKYVKFCYLFVYLPISYCMLRGTVVRIMQYRPNKGMKKTNLGLLYIF